MSVSSINSGFSHYAKTYSAYDFAKQNAEKQQRSKMITDHAENANTTHSALYDSIQNTISSSTSLTTSINDTINLPTTYEQAMKASINPQRLNFYV